MVENMLIKVTIEVLREYTHKIAGILFSCLIGQWGWSVWSIYSSLTTSLCQIVLCQSWKALQHGSADCFQPCLPLTNSSRLIPIKRTCLLSPALKQRYRVTFPVSFPVASCGSEILTVLPHSLLCMRWVNIHLLASWSLPSQPRRKPVCIGKPLGSF